MAHYEISENNGKECYEGMLHVEVRMCSFPADGMWKSIEIFVASEGITLDPTAHNAYIAMILYSNDGLRGVYMILVQLSFWYKFTKLSLVALICLHSTSKKSQTRTSHTSARSLNQIEIFTLASCKHSIILIVSII